jgi:hypothetical protein
LSDSFRIIYNGINQQLAAPFLALQEGISYANELLYHLNNHAERKQNQDKHPSEAKIK